MFHPWGDFNLTFQLPQRILSFQVSIIFSQSLPLAHSVIRWSQLENWKCFSPMEKSHWSPPWMKNTISWVSTERPVRWLLFLIRLYHVLAFTGWPCGRYYKIHFPRKPWRVKNFSRSKVRTCRYVCLIWKKCVFEFSVVGPLASECKNIGQRTLG